jgi:hypothetical protein
VTWRGNSEVSSLQGEAIRLKFEMHNAKLHAFEFKR